MSRPKRRFPLVINMEAISSREILIRVMMEKIMNRSSMSLDTVIPFRVLISKFRILSPHLLKSRLKKTAVEAVKKEKKTFPYFSRCLLR